MILDAIRYYQYHYQVVEERCMEDLIMKYNTVAARSATSTMIMVIMDQSFAFHLEC